MAPNRKSNGRGKRQIKLTQYEGESDEDYRKRRERNNVAVRKSREKAKKEAEKTHENVDILKLENCKLEAQIQMYRKQLTDLKGIFLKHTASGKVIADIDTLLRETDIGLEAKPPHKTT